jgi:gamma-glutamyl-gamma-aminobutyrate hydrolase PuuD
MRPLIGVTTNLEQSPGPAARVRGVLNAAYCDAVYAAGGLPLPIVPPAEADAQLVREVLERCDAIVYSGGADLDPQSYGQARHARTEVGPARRNVWDLRLFQAAAERDTPALSICLGCQIANVACGGALVQHVDDLKRDGAVEHYKPDHSTAYHAVRVERGSRLEQIVGAREFEVNSRHHQVLDAGQVGGGLRPVAFAPDGVIEAIEDPRRRFMVAVQWHPEDLLDRREHLALFRALVEAARG